MNSLAGFSSAVILVVFALIMVSESIERFVIPTEISFNQAISVACLGLLVNAISYFILSGRNSPSHPHIMKQDHHDHNLQSAAWHVLADALTSVFAIAELLGAKYMGFIWMDPLMGIVGAILVTQWSVGLAKDTSSILLDKQVSEEILNKIRKSIELPSGDKVDDLHVWAIGPSIYSAIISIITKSSRQPEHYKNLIPDELGLVHIAVEVNSID